MSEVYVHTISFTPQTVAYTYPLPQYVRSGLTYGPTASEYVGTFKFNKSIDAFVGFPVDPVSFIIAMLPEAKVTLNPEDVKFGITFGNNETGNSIGYLSINTTTARIAKPITETAILLS
jgi:hypothetical protein